MIPPTTNARLDTAVIIKLMIWSVVVGAILYWLDLSPGEIYGGLLDAVAGAWSWVSGAGLEYLLLGATIVVPIYLISQFSKRRNRD